MEILPLSQSPAWAALLALCFDKTTEQMTDLLSWLHTMGAVVAYGAWDGERLAAQYACLIRRIRIDGVSVEVGMSLNMCVHPDYRGQGLIKRVSTPVYAAITARGGVAGMGFSNAEGVQVDRHSKGYGYQVVGRLPSRVLWLPAKSTAVKVELSDHWPESFTEFTPPGQGISFDYQPHDVAVRYSQHPFRRYCYGIWRDEDVVRGVVVYRPAGVRGVVSLFGMYGEDVNSLLSGWARVMRQQGVYAAHLIGTAPHGVPLPYTRNPYYLTVKSLGEQTPPELFEFARWRCSGGDIL